MDTQLSDMSFPAGLCMDEEVLADSSEDITWLPWLVGKVPATGNVAGGVIDW